MLVIQFSYMKVVWLAFFWQKVFLFLINTIHRILCQNKKKILRKSDETILAKSMKIV